ncbi:MAG TPA: hypothetical protein VJ994_03290 [Paracoccaceae bacterium]|nr:hypothetical protein [Paracoccaceae bacterium]
MSSGSHRSEAPDAPVDAAGRPGEPPAPPRAGTAAQVLRSRGPDAAARLPRRRRAEALAALLPLVGLFLLMPPFIRVFAHDGRILGAPSVLVFILAVWIGLVVGARRLARRLAREAP